MAWHARALAADGQLEPAVELLERVLRVHARFAEARYNRAAYLARLGRLDEAGPELARALADGAARSRQAMVDPDFAPHLDHPAFAFEGHEETHEVAAMNRAQVRTMITSQASTIGNVEWGELTLEEAERRIEAGLTPFFPDPEAELPMRFRSPLSRSIWSSPCSTIGSSYWLIW